MRQRDMVDIGLGSSDGITACVNVVAMSNYCAKNPPSPVDRRWALGEIISWVGKLKSRKFAEDEVSAALLQPF